MLEKLLWCLAVEPDKRYLICDLYGYRVLERVYVEKNLTGSGVG